MKDPLQMEQTPYEVLGVDRSADRAQIERAFAMALGKRVPPNVAKNARDALLLYPARRAWYDLLQYSDEELELLSPSPKQDRAVLERGQRGITALYWEEELRARFPEPDRIHALAVFWYWWAVYEESRLQTAMAALGGRPAPAPGKNPRPTLIKAVRKVEGVSCDPSRPGQCTHADCKWREDCLSSAPAPQEMWEQVIGYWAILASGPAGQKGAGDLDGNDMETLREQLRSTLRNALIDLSGRYDKLLASGGGSAGHPWSDQYRALESTLTAELESAQLLREAGISRTGVGVQMLRRMGQLDATRTKVASALRQKPDSRALRKLRDMLAPWASAAVLVAQRKPEAALAAIKKLPADQQRSTDVISLRAQALHMQAVQKAGVGGFSEAEDLWESALEAATQAHNEQLAAEIRNDFAEAAHSRAAAISGEDPDEAIAILENAHALTGDQRAGLSLAALLHRRGVSTFIDGQKQLSREKKLTDAIIDQFERGRQDLETASALGSKESPEQARLAREFLGEALTARGISTINDAQESAKRMGELTQSHLSRMSEGLRDLERAAQLGSKKAAEQAKVARALVAQAQAIVDGNPELVRLLREADSERPDPRYQSRQESAGSQVWSVLLEAVIALAVILGTLWLGSRLVQVGGFLKWVGYLLYIIALFLTYGGWAAVRRYF